jgi:hypothetical protein
MTTAPGGPAAPGPNARTLTTMATITASVATEMAVSP